MSIDSFITRIDKTFEKIEHFKDGTDAKILGTQTSPLFPGDRGYYRHDQFKFTQKVTDSYQFLNKHGWH